MAWTDFFVIKKDQAENNNYKLDLFNTVSQTDEIANMSAIKKYFNTLYDTDFSGINGFNVSQTIKDSIYIAEASNKIARLIDYRNMSQFGELAQAIDMICYSSNIPDENNELIDIKINDPYLEPKDIESIRNCIQDYLDLFDFDNNIEEYFRTFIVEGQLCWENIVAKDDLEQGIIGINIIPNDAYEFCYDLKNRRKIGIMITNTMADNFNLSNSVGLRSITAASTALRGYSSLNCYEELLEDKCIVMPFDQLTYIDSGFYNSDNKVVYSPLERAKRPFNQLKLIEDAILIYRVSRSPEKYVFNVDVGKMGKQRGEMEVAKLQKQFGTKKVYDPNTGTIGKAYDPLQITENFWFVKGADSEGITVNPLQANHNFGNLDDLDYFIKKLLRSLNIPISRFFGEQSALINNGDDQGITADELNFAKFIMSLQKRFALGLVNGAITHLKYTGLWDLYKLTKNKIKIIINPPVEYVQYRRQKLLESKVEMLKSVLGEEATTSLFSADYALELFMGWDKDKIELNKQMKFKETIEAAKMTFIKTKIEETGTIDFKLDPDNGKSFSEILRDGLDESFLETGETSDEEGEGAEGEGDEFSDESTGDEFGDEGGEEAAADEGGEEV
jgi:hypothetical protein